jgi:hypothetical protein
MEAPMFSMFRERSMNVRASRSHILGKIDTLLRIHTISDQRVEQLYVYSLVQASKIHL